MKKSIGAMACLLFFSGAAAAEEVTLTTYYPAPYGNYDELTTEGRTLLATNAADLIGVGNEDPRRKLDVNGEIVAVPRLSLAMDLGTATAVWRMDNAAGVFRIFNQANIDDAGNERLRIDAAGLLTSRGAVYSIVPGTGGELIIGTADNQPTWHMDNADGADRFRVFRQPNLAGAGTEMLAVSNAGNVGILDNNPANNPPNNTAGNLDVNDVFLRSQNAWLSAYAAINQQIVQGPNSPNNGVSQANCPAGTVVSGGGYEVTQGGNNARIVQNMPSGNGWRVDVNAGRARAYAVCIQ